MENSAKAKPKRLYQAFGMIVYAAIMCGVIALFVGIEGVPRFVFGAVQAIFGYELGPLWMVFVFIAALAWLFGRR